LPADGECPREIWDKIRNDFGIDKDNIERFGDRFKYASSTQLIPDESTKEDIMHEMKQVNERKELRRLCFVDNYTWDPAVTTLSCTVDGPLPGTAVSIGNFPIRNNTVHMDFTTKRFSGSVEILPGIVHIFNEEKDHNGFIPVFSQTIQVTPNYGVLSGDEVINFSARPKKLAIIPAVGFTSLDANSLRAYHIHNGHPSFIRKTYIRKKTADAMRPLQWLACRVAYMVKHENTRVCSEACDIYHLKSPETLHDDFDMQHKIYALAGDLSYRQNFLFHEVLTRYAFAPKGDGEIIVPVTFKEQNQLVGMPFDVHAVFNKLKIETKVVENQSVQPFDFECVVS
jgi:hypothetical protein